MRKKLNLFLSIIMLLSFVACSNSKESNDINISVAASLTEPMNEIIEIFEKENNIEVNINSGGSGTLKNQISKGADVAIFFSANERYINDLVDEGLVNDKDVINPLSNTLVLIKNNENKAETITDIKNINNNFKISIGETETVPAGQYAKETLESLKLWEEVKDNIIFAKDVSSVRTYVELNEVDYGFIYGSDATNLKNSEVILEVDSKYHEDIIYSLAIINNYSDSIEVKELVNLINSEKGKEIFLKYGFKTKE